MYVSSCSKCFGKLSSRMETKGCCLLVSDVGDGVITEASNQSPASKTSGFLVSKIKSRDQFVQENAHWHQICVDAGSLPFKAKQRFGEACARYSQLEWCKILLMASALWHDSPLKPKRERYRREPEQVVQVLSQARRGRNYWT